jgi:poly(A) polymerase
MRSIPLLDNSSWLGDPALRRVFKALEEAGGEARVAGGAVRNALLGEAVADVDIATTLRPEKIMEAGQRAGLGVHPTGIDHGTITLTADSKPFEVTTLRVDTETYGRRARVTFTSDWEADARRRDFTVNALYCDLDGKIFDYVDGYQDFLRKRIRFIDDARARIREDYLRILRFFRFHARYGKGAPDREGLKACEALRDGLKTLSAERIRQEVLKLLVARRAVGTLKTMARHDILRYAIPHVSRFTAVGRMAQTDLALSLKPDALCRLVLISAKPDELRSRLKLSNEEAGRIQGMQQVPHLSPRLHDRERRAILYQVGERGWEDGVRTAWAKSRDDVTDPRWLDLLRLPRQWQVPECPVHGRDLIDLGFAAGPEIGEMLHVLEDWWIASDFQIDKQGLLQRAKLFKTASSN